MRIAPRLAWLAMAWTAVASAQDFAGVEANAVYAPTTNGPFVAIQPAASTAPGESTLGARVSFLDEPVTLNLPSPSATGTDTAAVQGLFVVEMLASAGVGAGFDVGGALSLHVFQWGSALSASTGGDDLDHFAVGDPRLTLGWSGQSGSFRVRPHLSVILPLGQVGAFASERNPRAEAGAAVDWTNGDFSLALDLAARLREVSRLGQTSWGPQARIGVGSSYHLSDQWQATLELQLMPTLYEQPEPLFAEAGYLLPAEVLAGIGHRWRTWTFTFGSGLGLPLSLPSTVNPASGLQKGLTSPNVRALIELRRGFQ